MVKHWWVLLTEVSVIVYIKNLRLVSTFSHQTSSPHSRYIVINQLQMCLLTTTATTDESFTVCCVWKMKQCSSNLFHTCLSIVQELDSCPVSCFACRWKTRLGTTLLANGCGSSYWFCLLKDFTPGFLYDRLQA